MKVLKNEILKACIYELNQKIDIINKEFASYQNSVANETKSTAGDKHDTARSMMQLEQEKMGAQLESLKLQKKILDSIDLSKPSNLLGNLIETDKGTFFISIFSKPVVIENKEYIPVSYKAPIGSLLIQTPVGKSFTFNSKEYQILSRY